jgi:hypothetical protein
MKTYAWAPSTVGYGGHDPLLEANVQVLVDQILEQNGFTRAAEGPDLLFSVGYETRTGYSHESFLIGMLTLNVYRAEQKELIWRGTASGTIHTDAASGDLNRVVESMLSTFPPK